MRGKSHARMGRYLLRHYMPELTGVQARAFLIGCIQPDRNPATYIKGSLRGRWLCGHHYGNASRFLFRLADRLEQKQTFSLWDYYSLGKLVHYTMDAFTCAHNTHFPTPASHRAYEVALQPFFLEKLACFRPPVADAEESCAEYLHEMHDRYMLLPGCLENDTAFTLEVCCTMVKKLTVETKKAKNVNSILVKGMI